MLTTSYISPAMEALDQRAVAAGITILNETGLDPGLDHLAAMKIIDETHAGGGTIESFRSFCGGLPAPEAADVPLKYKFSWSPRGVLTAGLNAASFREGGELKQIPAGRLFENAGPLAPGVFGSAIDPATGSELELARHRLEGYPNRDSLAYESVYGIDGAKTVLRGTIRYAGFAAVMRALQELGLSDPEHHPRLNQPGVSWAELVLSGAGAGQSDDPRLAAERWCAERYGPEASGPITDTMARLGLFDRAAIVAADLEPGTKLDALCALLQRKLG